MEYKICGTISFIDFPLTGVPSNIDITGNNKVHGGRMHCDEDFTLTDSDGRTRTIKGGMEYTFGDLIGAGIPFKVHGTEGAILEVDLVMRK